MRGKAREAKPKMGAEMGTKRKPGDRGREMEGRDM